MISHECDVRGLRCCDWVALLRLFWKGCLRCPVVVVVAAVGVVVVVAVAAVVLVLILNF